MRRYNLSEARSQFSFLVEEVASTGEPIIVMRRGKPLIKLVPCDPDRDEADARSLRGLPLKMSEDFDEPLDDHLWEVLSE